MDTYIQLSQKKSGKEEKKKKKIRGTNRKK